MRSFDVFDTVLTRVFAEPRDVFVAVGEALEAQGFLHTTPTQFAAVRQAAQDRAASRAERGEATLTEIYAELASAMKWEEARARAAHDLEIAVEENGVRPVSRRREEIAAARASGYAIIFLSDTQLPSSAIQRWLERAGFWAGGDRLFVSCEARATKRDGSLFQFAQRETGAAFSNWTHTGDNENADVIAPRRLGISVQPSRWVHLNPRERHLRGTGLHVSTWRSKLAGTSRVARLHFAPADLRERVRMETGADVAGPLLFGFTAWVLRRAAELGLKRLQFVSRGGQISHRLAELIQGSTGGAIELSYLYLSRRAFTGPSAWQKGNLREAIIAPRENVQTLARIRMNFGVEIPATLLPEADTDSQRPLTLAERTLVADWMLAPDRREVLDRLLSDRVRDAQDYFQQAGLPSDRVGFVDTGWAGTLQETLEDFFPHDPARVPAPWFYLGLREEKSPPDPLRNAHGYANHFAPLPFTREPWLAALLELFARADHGSVQRLQRNPTFEPGSPPEFAEVKNVQAAILKFGEEYLRADGVKSAASADFAVATWQNFIEFANAPTRAEADAWGRIPQRVHPADRAAEELCPPMTLPEVLARLAGRRARPPAWWLPGQASGSHRAVIRLWLWLRRQRA